MINGLNGIDSLEIGDKKVEVNMLQFADDNLFFCEVNTKSVLNIKVTLNCFELSSGLNVNFLKIRIGGLGIDLTTIQCLLRFLIMMCW